VGDDERRKNLNVLLAAYRRYHDRRSRTRSAAHDPDRSSALPLVLAGGARRESAGVEVEIQPGRERLAQLYAEAAALVHPSRHEGFGLTLAEAMYLGVPVLSAASAAVREVCGDAARYVEADDVEGLAAELDRLTDDEPLRADLSTRGRERAAQFSWGRSARAHIEAYTLALR
jgi:glycosyltransferase involved in cell wall biosynthesis